jgi:hypothetical protein
MLARLPADPLGIWLVSSRSRAEGTDDKIHNENKPLENFSATGLPDLDEKVE